MTEDQKSRRNAYMRDYQMRPERKAYRKKYYEANKDRALEQGRRSAKRWRDRNPGKTREAWNKWNQSDPIRYFLVKVKSRANRRGIKFDLKKEDIHFPKLCPVFGIELNYSGHYFEPNYPNLDRIVPSKGYVSGNVRIISHKANVMKQDGSAEEHERIAKYIRENTEFV